MQLEIEIQTQLKYKYDTIKNVIESFNIFLQNILEFRIFKFFQGFMSLWIFAF